VTMYVPQGIDNNTRAALGDIPGLENLAFGNESSIPGGITAQRMGIVSESGIIQTVQQGEIFDLARGEVANVVVIATDAASGTTSAAVVEVINTGEGVEVVAPILGSVQGGFYENVLVAELEKEDEVVVIDSDQFEEPETGGEYEDPGASDYVNEDGEYVPEDQVPVPFYDPLSDPFYDPLEGSNNYGV
jgi:hypothetical protein